MSIVLDDVQQAAIVDIVTTSRPVTRVHGYAGAGKTSAVMAPAVEAMRERGIDVQVLAPTGKAARVLRSKGLTTAATIHSYLYTPAQREREQWREAWEKLLTALEPLTGDARTAAGIIHTATPQTPTRDAWEMLLASVDKSDRDDVERLRSEKRYNLQFQAGGAIDYYETEGVPAADVLVIDEASMISGAVADDLARTGSRIIYCGDPAQLPPVGAGQSREAMGAPHHLLTRVYRQGEGSDVLQLATDIRTASDPSAPPTKRKRLLRLEDYSQVLCWRNATRDAINSEVRRRMGRTSMAMPEPGDVLVCLKNTKAPAENPDLREWMNGEQVTVLDAAPTRNPDTVALTVQDDADAVHEVFSPVATLHGHRAERNYLEESQFRTPDPIWAYGFALTVHKSQGSQWPSVLVVDETSAMRSMVARREGERAATEQARQWLYTAVSRAQSTVHLVSDISRV